MTSLQPVSSWDDYPVHQTAEFIRHVGTSDRNFYDRYYFCMFPKDAGWSAIFGLGQYPNLGTTDAFVSVRRGERQHVVRASRPLGDRMDLTVGPIRVEVLEPLRRLRVAVDPGASPLAVDVTFDAAGPAVAEPRHWLRSEGRVVFDTQRLAQVGSWSGRLAVDGNPLTAPGETWGFRDRSWGVRPVGEPEADGIRKGANAMAGMWNYFPMRFDDHAIYYICQERPDGSRPLSQATRVWTDPSRPPEELGHATHEHRFVSGTRMLAGSALTFPEVGLRIDCTPLLAHFISVGTGYGLDADWRHGMYQGPETVTQVRVLELPEVQGVAQYGVVDQVARYEYDGHLGFGLYEHGFFGPFPRYGMTDGAMGAP